MEDTKMSKKYYWILDGKYYEVSKETYQKYKKEHDHSKMLQEYENEVHIFSLDAMAAEDITGHDIIADTSVNVEEEAIHNLMLEKLREVLKGLSSDELHLIEQIYTYGRTEREMATELGISQVAVHKQKLKVLDKLKKFLEK